MPSLIRTLSRRLWPPSRALGVPCVGDCPVLRRELLRLLCRELCRELPELS